MMAYSPELAEEWSEQRHAALAYLAEVLGDFYQLSPMENDPVRVRVEQALVRRAQAPWPMTAQEAADYLEERVTRRFSDFGFDEWAVEWREVRDVRGLRILWGSGPPWLPVRAWADNFAAVRLEGLYLPVDAAGAQPLADYIYCVKHKDEDDGGVEQPWADWGFSEGPYCDEWEERLGPASDARSGKAPMARSTLEAWTARQARR
jgi:hypothetical protein